MSNVSRVVDTESDRDGHEDGESCVNVEPPEVGVPSHVDNGESDGQENYGRRDKVSEEDESEQTKTTAMAIAMFLISSEVMVSIVR